MKCCIIMYKQTKLRMKHHMWQKGNVLRKERPKRNYAMKTDAFFMLDALVGLIALLLALNMLLSIIQLMVKTGSSLGDDGCDTFYISMKIRENESRWRWQSETVILTEHAIIEIIKDDNIIKRSHQGGYEYLGSCQGVKFAEKGDDVTIVFEKTKQNEEKAVYSLTKKTK